MLKKEEVLQEKLLTIESLLDAMSTELRFRGCDNNHKLIRQARELSIWVKAHVNREYSE